MVIEEVIVTQEKGMRIKGNVFGPATVGANELLKIQNEQWRMPDHDLAVVEALTDEAFDSWEASLKRRQ